MSQIILHPATTEFAAQLLAFELDNRTFFESRINARAADYYSLAGVTRALAEAQFEAKTDLGYQYLIWHHELGIVGRINLSRVRRNHFHSAELGYRIAESVCGRGYASEAISQVLAKAFSTLGFMRIEAAATISNHASIRALLRNGFIQYGQSKRSFELMGIWHDAFHFEIHRQDTGAKS